MADYATVFYSRQMPLQIWNKEDFKKMLEAKKKLLVYASPNALKALDEEHVSYRMIWQREQFLVANLTFGFLNPGTRNSVCDKVYLLEASLQ